MIVEAQVNISGLQAAVWAAMTNIEKAPEIISGIDKIEILARPANALVGMKWRETRILFGKPATVEKSITQAQENSFYTTRAEDGGFVFLTTNRILKNNGSITLTGIHETIPSGIAARFKLLPMIFFKGMIRKAILKDLNDIKSAVEHLK